MPSATYRIFEQAMQERKQITCTYEGHYRELCPIILGHSDGQEKALTYQFAGESRSGLPPGGEWRCLFLSKARQAKLRDGAWHSGSSHTQPQGCVAQVDLDVNPSSPFNPKRRIKDLRSGDSGDETNAQSKATENRRSRDAWIRALQATSALAANPMRLLAHVIEDRRAAEADAPALISNAKSFSYSELTTQANRYSRWALERLAKGDVVCLLMPNRPEYVAIWLGITRVGGIVALINTNLVGASLAHAIMSVAPKYVIVAAELSERLQHSIPPSASFQTWIEDD